MARPAEKARSMLNKWTAMREGEERRGVGGGASSSSVSSSNFPQRSRRRPHLASEVEHLADAERFRNQIVVEIAALIGKIQNPALPESEMRDLNDSINHKMREKFHWNKRVYQLGGVDYNAIEKQRQLEQGDAQFAISAGGYRYFGAAKNLPGVKELLEDQAHRATSGSIKSQSAASLYKNISVDYYGWRDEEDGVLLELEAAADEINQPVRKLPLKRHERSYDEDEPIHDFFDMPSQQEIEQHILEHKKRALMAKYGL